MKRPSSGNGCLTINESRTMKKIYSFMVAAVALFAAASCNKELPQENLPAVGETVVYTASTDGADTKAVLNETTKKSEWVADDAITVHDGEKGWTFTAAEAGANVDFSNSEGFGEYRPVLAVYPAGTYTVDVAEKTVNANIPTYQSVMAGTYDDKAALAVAYSENDKFAFKNAHALIKFTVKSPNIKAIEFYGNNGEAITGNMLVSLNEKNTISSVVGQDTVFEEGKDNEWTGKGTWVKCSSADENNNWCFTNGETYYAVIAPASFDEGVSLNIFLNDGSYEGKKIEKVKTTTSGLILKANTILNIGDVEYVAPATVEKVYLQPGVWGADDAWFSAHFFNSVGGAEDVKMTDEDADGVYEVSVPAGMESVIFCRMNPEYTEFGWDVWEGETEVENHVWNQTGDLVLPLADDTKVYYNVTDWEAGEWSDTPQESTPEEDTKTYGICGDLTGWGDEDISMTFVDGKYVAYNVTFASAGGFKIRANNVWVDSDNWGLSATGAVEVGKYYDVITSGGSGNLTIIPGTYDIWFDLDNARIYIMKPGTSITTATKGTPIAPSSDVWYLIGEFNNWTQKDASYKFENEAGWFVLKNCNISKGGGVKINDGTWDVQRTGSVGLYASCELSSSGNDFYLPKGEYDIYMDTEAKNIYVLFPGETPTTTGSYRLYVKNSTSQSKVVLHAWGGYSTSWPGVELTGTTDVEGYGTCSYLELQKGTNPIVNFLIHNGSEGNKTADQNCSSLTILPTGDLYFEWK